MLRRSKREERPLIERPVLSDELPDDPEQPQKKKSWRKRLFRKKNKKGDELAGDRSNEYEVPHLSKSSSSASDPRPKPPSQQQQQQQEDLHQQQQQDLQEERHPEKRDPKNDRRDDSTSSGKSQEPQQQQEQPPQTRPDPLNSHGNDDGNRQQQLDLASPQPTVMSTFSKKKTPRAKGGGVNLSKASAPPAKSTMILKRPFGRDG
eukprot:CAMPEP_0117079814 /NCGR_PEP_ID=MMETSP0472-20121206/56330_1 /TAXON_ID=693140 ORGANISM="Tiarina fusus, Strain LIS" /NCGR_SAMPLE_ID=MMETSP0472 /ASSEMBLY_ACC=CAM_ASM_000603 /LENGTH=204 /DNA_ID=CAMNT_0004807231 /DNA_START=266 /DNA_END=876 /DNA_ORIENTATION=-